VNKLDHYRNFVRIISLLPYGIKMCFIPQILGAAFSRERRLTPACPRVSGSLDNAVLRHPPGHVLYLYVYNVHCTYYYYMHCDRVKLFRKDLWLFVFIWYYFLCSICILYHIRICMITDCIYGRLGPQLPRYAPWRAWQL